MGIKDIKNKKAIILLCKRTEADLIKKHILLRQIQISENKMGQL